MIHKYRAQFLAKDGHAPATIERVQALVRCWLESKEVIAPEVIEREGDADLRPSASVSVRHDVVGDEEQWALRYRRRDDRDALWWVVDVAAARSENQCVVSIAMGVELEEQRAVPLARRVRPPALVGQLAAALELQAGTLVKADARLVEPGEVPQLLRWLSSSSRKLPTVALTTDPYSERTLLDADDLQVLLLGLAEVVVLPKYSALRLTSSLQELLGGRQQARLWTVHSGAVRIYWPGADPADRNASPFDHKLWIPEGSGRFRDSVDEQVMSQVGWAAVHRRYDRWTDFRSIERKRDVEQLARAPQPAALRRLELELSEARDQITEVTKALRTAMSNAEEAWQVVRDLEIENARLKARAGAVAAAVGPNDPEEAVRFARRDFGRTLCFATDLVIDTNEGGEYWYAVLAGLSDLCSKHQNGEVQGGHSEVVTLLAELLAARGAPAKRAKHADTGVYKSFDGLRESVHLRWRLHLRSGALAETESIYWEPIDVGGERRFLVGLIGHHAE